MVGRSNILIDKDFRDLLPKGASNFEGQTQVGVKSALINAVDGLRVTPTRAANLACDHSRSARSCPSPKLGAEY